MTSPGQAGARFEDGFSLIELLVVMVLMGVIMTSTFAVIQSSSRSVQYQDQLRTTMDDARASESRIRKELRQARRVYTDATETAMHFWVDEDQDAIEAPTEKRCYHVREIPSTTDRYELVRWTEQDVNDHNSANGTSYPPCSDDSSEVPDGAVTLARTLRNVDSPSSRPPVFEYFPCLNADCTAADEDTNKVRVTFEFDVNLDAGPRTLPVTATLRLRNVP